LGEPDPERILKAIEDPGDVWHAGLRLGTAAQPCMMDFVSPTWMLNRDPDASINSTSWRISLRACLIRTEVLMQLGGLRPDFATLEAAALELGHRYVVKGAVTRHAPELVAGAVKETRVKLPISDELLFTFYRFGTKWSLWSSFRAVASGYAKLRELRRALRRLKGARKPVEPAPYASAPNVSTRFDRAASISVLIPTLDRQAYLRSLLGQLRAQTVRPLEIIVVDQTRVEDRDPDIAADFSDLPLKMFYLNEPGQCSSRNLGLQAARGDYIFFADDDIDVGEGLFQSHLDNLNRFGDRVSSGVINEVGAGPLPQHFRLSRVSDVFPMGNTMLKRDVLENSGLLDLAFEHGPRADGDLGMRVYLSGALMMLTPEAPVLHHRAPRGGLRQHKARVTTYAGSRLRLTERDLPSITEIYLALRYFTKRQVREMLLMRAAGTLSANGSALKKALKAIVGIAYMPDTLRQISERRRQAELMLQEFPRIPKLEPKAAMSEAYVGTHA
jgi:glycosyltransferase involved in cell wall biosynthesis